MDLTTWSAMLHADARAEIEAPEFREVLLNLMKGFSPDSEEYANLDFLQKHFRHAGEQTPADCPSPLANKALDKAS